MSAFRVDNASVEAEVPLKGPVTRRFADIGASPFDALLYAWQPRDTTFGALRKRSAPASGKFSFRR